MAASDPTPYVATPTGTLQGVAAFSWDGSVWQPSGRAGPDVATPTGVLQGVAPFSWSGSAWTPAGRSQPGVATPTGVLDGVAVYTWSGSAWTPTGGGPSCSTPSGALRGVAAFSWDGAAWQPSGQARPGVPTPYGVLDGVAVFNWGGSAWQAGAAVPAGATLDLSFMTGTLNPSLTFTRASTATYFDSSGTMRTAATNAPRFDYDPVTHALRGLLIEEARTNGALQSGNLANAVWTAANITAAAPVVTGNQVAAPDGTVTAARVVLPAVSGAGNASILFQGTIATAAQYASSIYMRGNVGGEQLYVIAGNSGATVFYNARVTLTTAWQRFSLVTPALTAASWNFAIGADLRDGTQTSIGAQTIFVWGAQVEQGAFPTSYIPTTAAAVTRAIDVCSMPVAAWFNANTYSLAFEFDLPITAVTIGGISGPAFDATTSFFNGNAFTYGGTNSSGSLLTPGAINKVCGTANANVLGQVCNNGGTIGTAVPSTGAQVGATRLAMGNDPWSLTTAFNGHIRRARCWPRVLSNAEMQSVTT